MVILTKLSWYIRMFGVLQSANLRSRLQYPASFTAEVAIAFFGNLTGFAAVWILVHSFRSIGGYSLVELALLYGVVTTSFAAAQLLFGGFDSLDRMIREGSFDRLLIRPLSPFFQVIASTLRTQRFGRLLEGIFVLSLGILGVAPGWSLSQWVLLLSALLGGICLFGGIMIAAASLTFVAPGVDPGVAGMFGYATAHLSRYPLSIFDERIRGLFTYVVPVGLTQYLPVSTLLNQGTADSLALPITVVAPLSGGIFLLIAGLFWRWAIQHYQSAGG
jgi:ABC-2 type transport system permease protein